MRFIALRGQSRPCSQSALTRPWAVGTVRLPEQGGDRVKQSRAAAPHSPPPPRRRGRGARFIEGLVRKAATDFSEGRLASDRDALGCVAPRLRERFSPLHRLAQSMPAGLGALEPHKDAPRHAGAPGGASRRGPSRRRRGGGRPRGVVRRVGTGGRERRLRTAGAARTRTARGGVLKGGERLRRDARGLPGR